jgi:hypothetical protein
VRGTARHPPSARAAMLARERRAVMGSGTVATI